jgi:hypothetical protein
MFCPFCGELVQIGFKFCPFCGREGETCDELITRYFRKGFAYEKIILFLANYHGIRMSLRTLNTKLRSLGLRRKNNELDINFVRDRIQQELDGPGNSAGYRSVWHTLKLDGIEVPRETVQVLVKDLDSEGMRDTSKNP